MGQSVPILSPMFFLGMEWIAVLGASPAVVSRNPKAKNLNLKP